MDRTQTLNEALRKGRNMLMRQFPGTPLRVPTATEFRDRFVVKLTLTFFLCLTVLAWSIPVSAVPVTISTPFNFRDNRSSNPVGIPAGDRNLVGAVSITPSGSLTTATATQGVTLSLFFEPFTQFPNDYVAAPAFDSARTGSWTITATNGPDSTTVLTNPIPNPQLLPLVTGLNVSGTGLTPTVVWTLPDLTGLSVDRIQVRVWDLDRDVPGSIGGTTFFTVKDIIFTSTGLAPSSTSFMIPSAILQLGRSYSFDVMLDDLTTAPGFGTFLQNRSETFSAPFGPVPEPATWLLLLSGLAGLSVLARGWQTGRDPGAGSD